jgi:hypothetical protein
MCRELVSKLRSMTETIKMLSTENVALREENDSLLARTNSGTLNRLLKHQNFLGIVLCFAKFLKSGCAKKASSESGLIQKYLF